LLFVAFAYQVNTNFGTNEHVIAERLTVTFDSSLQDVLTSSNCIMQNDQISEFGKNIFGKI